MVVCAVDAHVALWHGLAVVVDQLAMNCISNCSPLNASNSAGSRFSASVIAGSCSTSSQSSSQLCMLSISGLWVSIAASMWIIRSPCR